MRAFTFIELFFNRLAQGDIIQVPQNKQGFENLSKSFERPVEAMLFGVRIESTKQIGGCRFFQLHGGDEAEDFIPLFEQQ